MEFEIESVPIQSSQAFLAWFHASHSNHLQSIQENLDRLHAENKNCWQARRLTLDGQTVAGVYGLLQPGKLGVLVGPRVQIGPQVTVDVFPELIVDLVESVLSNLRDRGATLIQAILTEEEMGLGKLLERCSMRKLADLEQMAASVSLGFFDQRFLEHDSSEHLGPTDHGSDPTLAVRLRSITRSSAVNTKATLAWKRFEDADLATWLSFMESTYVGTNDCPELNGVREVYDTWTGYHFMAKGMTSEWWLLELDQRPIACLLLTPLTPSAWEVTYMAVHPAYRRMGVGRLVMEYSFQRARYHKKDWLFLSADRRNHQALELYREFGFSSSQIMQVWVDGAISFDSFSTQEVDDVDEAKQNCDLTE